LKNLFAKKRCKGSFDRIKTSTSQIEQNSYKPMTYSEPIITNNRVSRLSDTLYSANGNANVKIYFLFGISGI